jgi:hypothetical protein
MPEAIRGNPAKMAATKAEDEGVVHTFGEHQNREAPSKETGKLLSKKIKANLHDGALPPPPEHHVRTRRNRQRVQEGIPGGARHVEDGPPPKGPASESDFQAMCEIFQPLDDFDLMFYILASDDPENFILDFRRSSYEI